MLYPIGTPVGSYKVTKPLLVSCKKSERKLQWRFERMRPSKPKKKNRWEIPAFKLVDFCQQGSSGLLKEKAATYRLTSANTQQMALALVSLS